MNIGLAGEVRCVITKADGTVKEDTGYQKNIILNQGLDFFGSKSTSYYLNTYCVIGSGNSTPSVEQNTLDSYIALAGGTSDVSSDYDYIDNGDDLYKMSQTTKYRFDGLDNVNISEVGLASVGGANYYLCTRALLKDSAGNATTITVLTGETLDIYYKIWRVISTLDNTYVINLLDGEGGSVPYNVTVRPAMVGTNTWVRLGRIAARSSDLYVQEAELGEITSRPAGYNGTDREGRLYFGDYTPGSYKIIGTVSYGVDKANVNIRSLHSCHSRIFDFFPFQMRFGSVADDSPIVKTNTQTLNIPFEVSWGRYEEGATPTPTPEPVPDDAFKYWRLSNIVARVNTKYTSFAEIQFIDSDGVNLATNPSNAFASSFYNKDGSRGDAAFAFDGDPVTWAAQATQVEPYKIGYQFDTPVTISKVGTKGRDDLPSGLGWEIKSTNIDVSNDGATWLKYGEIAPNTAAEDSSLNIVDIIPAT